ncbi:hypothetical protein ONZ43_g5125 [Nemania bipapillata]|uniref:Uncharacterized protein n=1 Tax=Nemania bipapillata TaxID=110536 RepID=A0ACC2IEE5_9PEZI|nr:hypothetical protein ONZ43_g5125 [Nemania bipapillata]
MSKHLPNRTFALPAVLYHTRYDARYFLVTSRVPGETAARLWWDFDDAAKDRYANLIVQACVEVATLTSSKLGTGIDGTAAKNDPLGEALTRKDMPDILANCDAVNLSAAEFVPREWIGVNFARALAMVQDPPIPENYLSNDYAQRVWRALQRRGFGNDGSVWLNWKRIDWQ